MAVNICTQESFVQGTLVVLQCFLLQKPFTLTEVGHVILILASCAISLAVCRVAD